MSEALATRVSLAEFSHALGTLYETAYEPSNWQRAVDTLREVFRANFVTLIVRPESDSDVGNMITAGKVFESRHEKRVQYNYPSPFVDLVSDRVYTIGDLMGESEWRASPFYQHFCGPYGVFHVMAADIRTLDDGEFKIRVTRDEDADAFDEADRQLLALLLPHLKRTLNLQTRMYANESVGLLYSEAVSRMMVATIVLDEKAQILEQNQIARTLLSEGDGLKRTQGRLEASYPGDNRALQALIKDSLARSAGEKPESDPTIAEALSLARPSGRVSLGVVVKAVPPNDWVSGRQRPAAIVYIRDAEQKSQAPLKVTQKLFGLTQAESQLAVHLANGLSLEEAAEELGIRHNTARAHLRSIFSKTGVRRQTELVRIMLNSVSALGQQVGSN
ncbi:helix-turn-helix transcriptional regulator [Crenobacter caeni]|uniref:Helix-turn-helix transcriptional regulator n=1 Tax=Crenobacter caeni TaxID=2705474 RepID=A0A6B2KR44_9NEIS|nr:helix-turn-helix transcriptional regulator [Crenobacter caeni]NDV12706.1 helix-turn-helix transcriptional regulator [Crenobacter caeni]